MRLPRRLLRFAFHLLYHQMAWSYDAVAWLASLGQWAAWRRAVSLFLREGPILELAHGTGGLMADLTVNGLRPVGLDLSPYMCLLARRRMLTLEAHPRLVRARGQSLPFLDAAFANVVATFPTEFILEPDTLASIRRVLQPEGHLVVVAMGYLRGPDKGPSPSTGRSPDACCHQEARRSRLVEAGLRWATDFIDWLYRVTGQRQIPEQDCLDNLRRTGFEAEWRDAVLDGASARLLVATLRRS